MLLTLESGPVNTYVLLAANGESELVQSDWDFPHVAALFGFSPCPCGGTDGTIECTHRSVAEMIFDARDFLDEHIGDVVDNPDYF